MAFGQPVKTVNGLGVASWDNEEHGQEIEQRPTTRRATARYGRNAWRPHKAAKHVPRVVMCSRSRTIDSSPCMCVQGVVRAPVWTGNQEEVLSGRQVRVCSHCRSLPAPAHQPQTLLHVDHSASFALSPPQLSLHLGWKPLWKPLR